MGGISDLISALLVQQAAKVEELRTLCLLYREYISILTSIMRTSNDEEGG